MSDLLSRGRFAFVLSIGAAAFAASSVAAAPADSGRIAAAIKADVAQLVAGINTRDAVKATSFDAPDVVVMECDSPGSTGMAADRAGFKKAFAANPDWRVRLIDETVDVAKAGDMAVYRGAYYEDSSKAGVPMTHRVNFIAGFKRQGDGAWKIQWQVISPTERSHKK